MPTYPPSVDYWSNIFTPEGLRHVYLENEELRHIVEWWSMDDRLKGYTVDAFVRMMDDLNIRKVFVPSFQMWNYVGRRPLFSISAEDVATLIVASKGRVGGLFGFDVTQGMEAIRKFERAVKEDGFEGGHIHAHGFGIPLNHRDLYPFYAKCVELDVPVIVQTGHSAERMPSAMGMPIHLDDVALYFPELRIVASHTGWPWVQELVALSWKHRNLFIGTGAHAPKYWDAALVRFLNSRGKGKVLWGTVFPVVTHAAGLEQIEALQLKPDAYEALLSGAARSVFKRLEG